MLYGEIIKNLFRTIQNIDLQYIVSIISLIVIIWGILVFFKRNIPKANLQTMHEEYYDYDNRKIIVRETYVINNVNTRLFQILRGWIYNKVLLLSITNNIKCEISGFDNLIEVNINSYIEITNKNRCEIKIKNLYKYLNMYDNKFTITKTLCHNMESKILKNETDINIVIKNDSNYMIKNYYFETSECNYEKLKEKINYGVSLENDKFYKCYISGTLDPMSIKHIYF